jgi:hypothetical protein
MHNPMFKDVLDESSEETDTQCSNKKKRNKKKKNRPNSDMGWKKKLNHHVNIPDYNDFEGTFNITCLFLI